MSDAIKQSSELLKELIHHLATISNQIDKSDLGELARMHEFALQFEQFGKALPGKPGEVLAKFGRKAASTVEELILESCPTPDQTLDELCHIIQNLDHMTASVDTLPLESMSDACLEYFKTETTESSQAPEYLQEPLIISEQELEYVQSFLTECNEHIECVESGLLALEQTPQDSDKINEIFRAFHTIKGMAGFLNLRDVQALTHEVESLLDLGRKGQLQITPAIIDLIFEALDVLKVQVNEISHYIKQPTGRTIPQPPIADLIQRVSLAAKGKIYQGTIAGSGASSSAKLIGEILSEDSEVSPELVEYALQQQKTMQGKPVGAILQSFGAVRAKDVSKALRKQKETVQETSVRVDTMKLDGLINLVGELMIIQAQVEQNPDTRQIPALSRLIEQVSKITRDVQEVSMSMRMVPIGQTFQKMGRVLRDLARKVEKKVTFEIDGEETELDKNVIQELSDPLMHMIRNAVDHGLESPEERKKSGKPETGTVTLKAFHQSGNIVIEISDDGKGLDKDALLRKAMERGLIDPDAKLTEQQIFGLIMAAGFSTAEKITDISGRGVGMDVVKRNIEKLRGKVEIRSIRGEGTTFSIRLPLTLAVIDGMIIRVGSQKFILPTLSIVQSLAPRPEQIKTVQGRSRVLNLREQIYPLLPLREMFDAAGADDDDNSAKMVVIAQAEDQQVGLEIDDLIGQQQVVIKSLGDRFKTTKGVTGGAILGDGTIGLILEPAGLLELFRQSASEDQECAVGAVA